MYMMLGLALLPVHLAVCALVFFGIASGALKVRMDLLPLVMFVPLWGVVCVLLSHFQLMTAGENTAPVGVEKLRVNEEIYRGFAAPAREEGAAPLEDVLLLDDGPTRRSQLLHLLNDRPERYLDLLRRASRNEDVEVVHYATTAMSELNKDYDLQLQRAEKRWREDPRRLEEYLRALGEYLDKAMAPRRIRDIQRRQYVTLLAMRQQQAPTLENGLLLTRQLLLLEEFEQAEEQLHDLLRRWPAEQQVWLLRLELAARCHDGTGVRRVLRQAQAAGVWFDGEARRTLAFWQQEAAG